MPQSEVLSRAVGHKSLPEGARLMNRVKMIGKLQERLHDSVLVGLIGKYVDEVLLDEGEGETNVMLVVQYEKLNGSKYYEATCVRVEQGVIQVLCAWISSEHARA